SSDHSNRQETPMAESPIRILAPQSAAPRIALEICRRRFLSLAALAGGTVALAACTPGGGGSTSTTGPATGGALENSLSIYTWGDYDAPEVLEAFTGELGPRITMDSYSSNEELVAKLIAAKGTSGYDIIVPTGVFVPQMIENGLLMKLNKDLLPNLSNL